MPLMFRVSFFPITSPRRIHTEHCYVFLYTCCYCFFHPEDPCCCWLSFCYLPLLPYALSLRCCVCCRMPASRSDLTAVSCCRCHTAAPACYVFTTCHLGYYYCYFHMRTPLTQQQHLRCSAWTPAASCAATRKHSTSFWCSFLLCGCQRSMRRRGRWSVVLHS